MQTITIDACSLCQLQCVQCPISQMGYKNTIKKGYLTFESFNRLVKDNPGIKAIKLDCSGELFLNQHLRYILMYAFNDDVMLSCPGGVNLNTVTEETLKDLVRFRFQYLNVSIDGASQDTYEQYRVGGDFAEVIHNINIINDYKRKFNTPYPKLQWQFIVFGHNEHEIRKARKTAEELGMRFYPKMNWNSTYSPIKDTAEVKRQTGWEVTTREEYEKKYKRSYVRSTCYELWGNPRLSWDVSVTGCSWNTWDRFDAVTVTHARKVLMGKYPVHQPIPCNQCEILLEMDKTKNYLTRRELWNHLVKHEITTRIKYWMWRRNL